MDLVNELLLKVTDASGFSLSLVGMAVVFCGLITLFITMLILNKTTTGRAEKKAAAQTAAAAGVNENDEIDMDEIAAAIGLALNLHVLRNSPKKMTIKRLTRSSWKEASRARAMERL